MRGCWTTVRHSAEVRRRRLLEDLLRHGDLADVVEQRGDAQPVDLGVRQLELLGHRPTIEAISADGWPR